MTKKATKWPFLSNFVIRHSSFVIFSCLCGSFHQCENPRLFCAIVEGTEGAYFFQAPHSIERIEIIRVARGQFRRLQIAAAQISVPKSARALPDEKMKAQPSAVRFGYALSFAKKRYKEQKHEISVDLRLKLKVAGKIFRSDFALSILELQRGMQGVI